MKIDTEKFIVDILQQLMAGHPLKVNILYALLKQGLVYTDGSIVRIVNTKEGPSITNDPASDSIWPKGIIAELDKETKDSTSELVKQIKKIVFWKEPDIDAMVEKYYNEVLLGECGYPESLATHYRLCYYQGLKDMYQKLKELCNGKYWKGE